jgi:adenylate cyclase
VRGIVASHIERDYVKASEFYNQALEIDSNESLAWIFKSTLHSFAGEGTEAVAAAERALALSPLDPLRYYFASLGASAYLTARKFEKALVLAEESMRLNRRHMSTHRVRVIGYALSGQTERSMDAAKTLLSVDPKFTIGQFLSKHPSGQSVIGIEFAEALASAGIPR